MKMGGGSVDDCWEQLTTPADEARTVVLVGGTGNGKSATGNSILGREEFKSERSFSGVTGSCSLQKTVLQDGKTVNVIDTPGLFDPTMSSESIRAEIVRCLDLARDGIHAVLLVFSIWTRFSEEEANALQSLQKMFGERIADFVIVVFTSADELPEEEDLASFLEDAPSCLKKVLNSKNRQVLFDNRTTDGEKKAEQVHQLFSAVNSVLEENGGQPFTNEPLNEFKKEAEELQIQEQLIAGGEEKGRRYDDHIRQITEMFELKHKEMNAKLKQQLAGERAALKQLHEDLRKAHGKIEDLRNSAGDNGCSIM